MRRSLFPTKNLSIRKGGIEPLGKYRNTWIFWQIEAIAEKNGFTLDTPISEIPEDALNKVLYGSDEVLKAVKYSAGDDFQLFPDI